MDKKIGEFNSAAEEFGAQADFLLVYVKEAHPTDEWALGFNKFNYKQQKNLNSRLETATQVRHYFKIKTPVVADTMSNVTCVSYSAFPIRVCIIKDNRIQFLTHFDPMGGSYNIFEQVKQML
ncbi:hypothetical protein LOTGIDRAFT_165775 [Lottia gigantea]|uniref:Iodothyronine deiodinase n=1 Tax=Lottia gigantea TaxID=225164 RepID=V4A523_LOTGI|nr:hypothetical protein LOTGIDRAFT_165775 [Lottia gigantea]ESO88331.1 hypothetical protein LOTGIDRAFT_165775 [Lottia gigantea]